MVVWPWTISSVGLDERRYIYMLGQWSDDDDDCVDVAYDWADDGPEEENEEQLDRSFLCSHRKFVVTLTFIVVVLVLDGLFVWTNTIFAVSLDTFVTILRMRNEFFSPSFVYFFVDFFSLHWDIVCWCDSSSLWILIHITMKNSLGFAFNSLPVTRCVCFFVTLFGHFESRRSRRPLCNWTTSTCAESRHMSMAHKSLLSYGWRLHMTWLGQIFAQREHENCAVLMWMCDNERDDKLRAQCKHFNIN